MSRNRLRMWGIAAIVLALICFLSGVQALQWAAVILLVVSILILTFTLFTGTREGRT